MGKVTWPMLVALSAIVSLLVGMTACSPLSQQLSFLTPTSSRFAEREPIITERTIVASTYASPTLSATPTAAMISTFAPGIPLPSSNTEERGHIYENLPEIAFVSDRGGQFDIYLMYSDGSNVRRLLDNGRINVDPAWSPDGMQIAFTSIASTPDGTFQAIDVLVMNSDGTGAMNLTSSLTDEGLASFDPVWSPDGTQLAFTGGRTVAQMNSSLALQGRSSQVYVVNRDGSDLVQITDVPDGLMGCQRPTWMPTKSRQLMIYCVALTRASLIMYDVDAREALGEDFSLGGSMTGRPLISPSDAQAVCFCGGDYLMVFPMDRPSDARIIGIENMNLLSYLVGLTWSPINDQSVIWITTGGVYLMNIATSETHQITAFGLNVWRYERRDQTAVELFLSDSEVLKSNPAMSISGRYLLFQGGVVGNPDDKTSNSEIYLLDVETQTLANLTSNPAIDVQSVWQP